MRVFEEKKRLAHSLDTIDYFMSNEYDYYSKNNVRGFDFDGVSYESLYLRVNIQLMITKKCPFDCSFCVEKINCVGTSDSNIEAQLKSLRSIITELKAKNLLPTVTITGGEPLLYPGNVLGVKSVLDGLDVMGNLNTSGFLTERSQEVFQEFERINLSVHHKNADVNSSIFGALNRGDYWNLPFFKHATIQHVMTDNRFDNLVDFLSSFNQNRFSIRFPSRTKNDNSVEWKNIFHQIETDDRFKFVQQKIGDHYWYEEYLFNGKTVRFSFSDLLQLEYYNSKLENDKKIVREIVILPNGEIQFDWVTE